MTFIPHVIDGQESESASGAPPSATVAQVSCVYGSTESNRAPSSDSRSSPPMTCPK